MSIFYRTENICLSKMKFSIDAKHTPDAFSGKGGKRIFFQELFYTFKNQARVSLCFEEHKPEFEFQLYHSLVVSDRQEFLLYYSKPRFPHQRCAHPTALFVCITKDNCMGL